MSSYSTGKSASRPNFGSPRQGRGRGRGRGSVGRGRGSVGRGRGSASNSQWERGARLNNNRVQSSRDGGSASASSKPINDKPPTREEFIVESFKTDLFKLLTPAEKTLFDYAEFIFNTSNPLTQELMSFYILEFTGLSSIEVKN